MSRLDLIAKKLNSVGLNTDDDLQDALMEYFCEDVDTNNTGDSDSDDCDTEQNVKRAPLSSPVNLQIDKTRPVFSYGAWNDDTETFQTIDLAEDQLVIEWLHV